MMICTKKEAAEAASFFLLTLAPSAILSVSAACIAAAGIISITAWVTSARFTAHFPARREKFIHRELETIEYITRVLCIIRAVAAAFTLRHADVKRRHQQLNIPLETQNRKLSQCYKKAISVAVQRNVLSTEAVADRCRNRTQFTSAAAAIGRLYNLCFKQNRLYRFNYCITGRFMLFFV